MPRDPGSRSREVASRKRLLGTLLVRDGLITRAQLQEALRLQAELGGHLLLGQVLVDRAAITQEQLAFVLERHGKKHRLGDLLVETQAITEAQLEAALDHQRRTDLQLGDVLVQLGFVTEPQMRQALSTQLGIPFVDLDASPPDPGLAHLISESYARHHRVIPIQRSEDRITLAMDDPSDLEVVEELQAWTRCRIGIITATRAAFDRAYARLYGPGREPALEWQHRDIQRAHDRLRREHEELLGTLAELQASRDVWERERQGTSHMLGELAALLGLGGGTPMAEVNMGDLRAVVDAARRVVSDWDAFVGSVEGLGRESEERRTALERLEQEHSELREAHDRLRRDLEGTAQALAELRTAHEALLREHEAAAGALNELRARYDTVVQDREFAADQLETVLRRIKI